MSLAEKITALLEGFTRYQVESITPLAWRQLANACQRVLAECNRTEAPPKAKSGVLAQLKEERSQ